MWKALAFSVLLAGMSCKDSSSTSPTSIVPVVPTGPVTTVVKRGGFNIGTGVPCGWLKFIPFTTSMAGDIDANVNWFSIFNNLDVAITPGRCTCDRFYADACGQPVAISESLYAKPETIFAFGQPAGGIHALYIECWRGKGKWHLQREFDPLGERPRFCGPGPRGLYPTVVTPWGSLCSVVGSRR